MSGVRQVVSDAHSGISPEQARDARARAWAYAFQCFHRRNEQEGGPYTALDDRKGLRNDPARTQHTKQLGRALRGA